MTHEPLSRGAPHLHLNLIPRHVSDPLPAAWSVADHYRAVAAGERPPVDPRRLEELEPATAA